MRGPAQRDTLRELVVKLQINRLRSWLSGWSAVFLGALSGFGIVLSSSQLGAIPRPHSYKWFLSIQVGTGALAHLYLYLSIIGFVLAWWALGAGVESGWPPSNALRLPFSLGRPPSF